MKDDKTKIHALPNANLDNARAESLKRLLPDFADEVAVIAEIRMINYKAHLEQGFTADQALKLCVYLSQPTHS